MTEQQRRWLKRRQAIEPTIGHTKRDHGMRRCWFKGDQGDALHAVLCAAGFNIHWLLQAIGRGGIAALLLALFGLSVLFQTTRVTPVRGHGRSLSFAVR